MSAHCRHRSTKFGRTSCTFNLLTHPYCQLLLIYMEQKHNRDCVAYPSSSWHVVKRWRHWSWCIWYMVCKCSNHIWLYLTLLAILPANYSSMIPSQDHLPDPTVGRNSLLSSMGTLNAVVGKEVYRTVISNCGSKPHQISTCISCVRLRCVFSRCLASQSLCNLS